MTDFHARLNEALKERDMRPSELARISGVNEGAISQYRKGSYKATQANLEKIARALNVPIAWLMGAEVPSPFYKPMDIDPAIINAKFTYNKSNKKIPPSTDNDLENLENYLNVTAGFSFTVQDNSMVRARIFKGDKIFAVSQFDTVQDGDIVVVSIPNENGYILRRIYGFQNRAILMAEAPGYAPITLTEDNLDIIRVVGIAKKCLFNIE